MAAAAAAAAAALSSVRHKKPEIKENCPGGRCRA
jgi:hypothetical protein